MTELVRNERTKLTANALDRASTACMIVGVLCPAAAAFYGMSGIGALRPAFVALWSHPLVGGSYLAAYIRTTSSGEFGMTGIWLFAYVVLPIVVVALGYGAVLLNERSLRRSNRQPTSE